MGNFGDAGSMGAEFLVTPKELIHSALLMGSAAEKAKKELLRLSGLVQETDSCFQGTAKEFFVGKADALVSEWKNLLDGLHNNITVLQEIADNYEQAEGENVNAVMENGS